MEIRKSLTAISAALMMIGVNAPAGASECGVDAANPDPTTIAANLVGLAEELRCAPGTEANPGTWPSGYPIWQKRGGGSCDVQDSLARKLDEEREFEEGSKPPRNKHNTNDAAGAANDVENGKYLAAVEKLDAFVTDAYKGRLTIWGMAANGFENALAAKTYFVNEVGKARGCICKLTECE